MTALHLVIGITGAGKTARAVALAHRHHSPVLALDRVQCHTQLAIGSGRPTMGELQGTQRIYPIQRPVRSGPVTAAEAVDHLVHQRKSLNDAGVSTLVLEGGSISILHELAARHDWSDGATVHVECWLEASVTGHATRTADRVERMLGYGTPPADRTLVDELTDLWPDPEARRHLCEVIGYRELIDLCACEGLDPGQLRGQTARLRRAAFAGAVTDAHLDYAHQQRLTLAAALPTLADRSFEVTLCEN
ncbi:isopentenyl transferase family protein [Streptomyces sp. MI02-7b]|uniref:isopentenyl transferase family protein n=1 Tax=Streptomyces sp. MI02-7b TaxID=462941 RepID=UPI0029BC7E43|nr:isopentenyl transferase family protein [Streptomyces sp. MI02-7b]MDX3075811.1 isopentenyl transferase family protein [Streptomyces sp. MI02-7b]